MALTDAKEVKQARQKVRDREQAVFKQAAATGKASREAREQAESQKEGAKEGASPRQRKGTRASA